MSKLAGEGYVQIGRLDLNAVTTSHSNYQYWIDWARKDGIGFLDLVQVRDEEFCVPIPTIIADSRLLSDVPEDERAQLEHALYQGVVNIGLDGVLEGRRFLASVSNRQYDVLKQSALTQGAISERDLDEIVGIRHPDLVSITQAILEGARRGLYDAYSVPNPSR